MTALNAQSLGEIDPRVPGPSYDRDVVTSGIVHLGVGVFHRAHEAMYVDALLEGASRGDARPSVTERVIVGGRTRCTDQVRRRFKGPTRHCLACAKAYLFDSLAHMAIWDQLVERAAEQHGYVTTRDARDLGIDPTQLRLLAARGRLERVGRGAYRVPVLPRGEHDDLAEAVAWSLGRGVVSHESALVLRGLSDVNPSRVHLTVPRDNHPRAAGGDLYRLHRRALPASDVTEADGIPATTVPRTVRDCLADGTDPYQLRLAIDRAEAEGLVRRAVADELRFEVAAVGTAVQG